MSVPVRDFLKRRRDRALGSILGYAEREVFSHLNEDQRKDLRRAVLDAINGYHDSVLDLMKAEDSDALRNEAVVDLLNRVDARLRATYSIRTGVSSEP